MQSAVLGRQKQKLLSVFSNGDIRQSVQPLKDSNATHVAFGGDWAASRKRKRPPLSEEELGRNEAEAKRLCRIFKAPYGKETESAGEEDPSPGAIAAAPARRTKTLLTNKKLPKYMQKYWEQRYRLFSLYDKGIRMDKEGWWSVTPESIAAQIAERCRCTTILDAFTGVGGNAIQFAFTCERVIALDIDPIRLACAAHNATIYGVADRIQFILADYTVWAKEYALKSQASASDEACPKIDVVFLSPPWGGVQYQSLGHIEEPSNSNGEYPLRHLQPISGKDLFDLSRTLAHSVALYLPRNTAVSDIANLATENIEIEEAWMGNKLKALTVYTGDLVDLP